MDNCEDGGCCDSEQSEEIKVILCASENSSESDMMFAVTWVLKLVIINALCYINYYNFNYELPL